MDILNILLVLQGVQILILIGILVEIERVKHNGTRK